MAQNKAEIQYSFLCDDIRKEETGKLIFVGEFNRIGNPVFPFFHQKLFIATCWYNIKESCKGKVQIFKPTSQDTNPIFDQPTPISLSPDPEKTRIVSVVQLLNFQFTEPGKYKIRVLLDDVECMEYWLEANKLAAPGQADKPFKNELAKS